MSKFLVKTVDVYRVDTVSEVEQFHQDLKNSKEFELASFAYQQKQVKQKGEIIDEYCLVSVKKVFNSEKEPTNQIDVFYGYDAPYDEVETVDVDVEE